MSALLRSVSLSFLIAFTSLGCAGGHGSLAANSAKFPVSMSGAVRDTDGKLLSGDDLTDVGRVRTEYHAWSMFWNMIPLSGERDISEEINSQVQAAGGEAVVDLGVTSSNCTWNFFTLIGFLPDCTSVAVEGRIVKRGAGGKTASPEAAPTTKAAESTAPSPAASAKPKEESTAATPAQVAASETEPAKPATDAATTTPSEAGDGSGALPAATGTNVKESKPGATAPSTASAKESKPGATAPSTASAKESKPAGNASPAAPSAKESKPTAK